MTGDRVTVSLDSDASAALETLTSRTENGQSELVRQALTFYAANFEAATADASANLEEYHRMLAGGEHVLLDVDFLHCFLEHIEGESGDPDPDFLECTDRVAEYHTSEYDERFTDLGELLDWLSFCGFLTVRETEADTYHIVFPTESMKWFMLRFIERSTASLDFDIDVNEGVSKVLLTERHE
ncbi:ribbon-helix-helix protein, CopG family [Halococcus salifodinae]|uniref:Ribbon-helix-helix protein, copG family n=1 Tax=Halococcus salifodinae DSM 8989 TaxID=1227456 RepID=M0MY62_9EURY|nr:ribbon-helix-helix protein, CopG family [Halococcus salifodinae]EMA49794.1 Ribbon-helix-helix protein, copG family [Halococcus salifodinae DSM 8989]